MRCRFLLDKRFFKYIKEKKNIFLIAITFSLGILFIFIGGGKEEEVSENTDIEERLAAAFSSMEGVGRCEVLLYCSDYGKENEETVQSVIVICEGADSVEVRSMLTSVLSSFFGVGTNRIRIEKLKE